MAKHNDLGKAGEKAARQFLRRKGYTIRDYNWISGKKELDIVAETDQYLVIVEVKSRSTEHFEHPKDAITNTKIRHIVEAAHDYILKYDIEKDVRFDFISALPKNGTFEIEHIEDAFLAPVN
ncbi:MAG: YraN family protein [Paludibacteraceae bacterium]|jgi:putative endonuclease|nr:YraN family protein [Paludibacteraceae bacterium]MBP9039027.1 YraN family protein [Paludibacteraceae bacterium]HPB84429.1 YraN family protein [Paludibacteraceae bacterium]